MFVGDYRDGELTGESKQWWKSGELMLTRTLDRGAGSVRVLHPSGAVAADFECVQQTVARAKWIDASGAVSGTFEPGADRRPQWAAPPPMRGDGLDYVCRGTPILLYQNAVLAR